MKNTRLNRREILENCIVKGLLVAGVPMSASNLLAFWQNGERALMQPFDDGAEQRFLGFEMMVQRLPRQPGGLGRLLDR